MAASNACLAHLQPLLSNASAVSCPDFCSPSFASQHSRLATYDVSCALQSAIWQIPRAKKDRGSLGICRAAAESFSPEAEGSSTPATDEEREMWEKRKSEADASVAPIGNWEWTLNWDHITPALIVGSCPRSPSDMDRLVDEAGVTAILNLQSDVCFNALQIPAQAIRERALERGVLWERVPTIDFNRGDQALMLPEAVRMLNMLLERGQRVYCHCTAGINRASLAALGYLTFVQGLELEEALAMVKGARKVANPYLECWTEVQRRLLEGRQEELTALAKETYRVRCEGGVHGNASTDWSTAQSTAIRRSFQRWLEVDMLALEVEREILQRTNSVHVAPLQEGLAAAEGQLSVSQEELASSQTDLAAVRVRLVEAQQQLATSQALLSASQSQLAASQQDLHRSQSQLAASQADLAATLRELVALRGELADWKEQRSAALEEEKAAATAALQEGEDLECNVVTRSCSSETDSAEEAPLSAAGIAASSPPLEGNGAASPPSPTAAAPL